MPIQQKPSPPELLLSSREKNNKHDIFILEALRKSSRAQNVKDNLISTALANSKDSCVHDGKTRKHLELWRETSNHARSVKDGKECMMCQCYVSKSYYICIFFNSLVSITS